jgi:hypothetical protein
LIFTFLFLLIAVKYSHAAVPCYGPKGGATVWCICYSKNTLGGAETGKHSCDASECKAANDDKDETTKCRKQGVDPNAIILWVPHFGLEWDPIANAEHYQIRKTTFGNVSGYIGDVSPDDANHPIYSNAGASSGPYEVRAAFLNQVINKYTYGPWSFVNFISKPPKYPDIVPASPLIAKWEANPDAVSFTIKVYPVAPLNLPSGFQSPWFNANDPSGGYNYISSVDSLGPFGPSELQTTISGYTAEEGGGFVTYEVYYTDKNGKTVIQPLIETKTVTDNFGKQQTVTKYIYKRNPIVLPRIIIPPSISKTLLFQKVSNATDYVVDFTNQTDFSNFPVHDVTFQGALDWSKTHQFGMNDIAYR